MRLYYAPIALEWFRLIQTHRNGVN